MLLCLKQNVCHYNALKQNGCQSHKGQVILIHQLAHLFGVQVKCQFVIISV